MNVLQAERAQHGDVCWTEDYCLRHCEGYRVFDAAGAVGYVDTVRLTHDGNVRSIVVRGPHKAVTVPARRLEQIDPARERLRIV